ncbi:hypothetical protein XMV242_002325 [Marinobacterium sp. xm-v-242]|uniref:virion core protein, T7 gp14 family n=1 Tax=Marinobacterium sp. xm-v-242 TaxID=2497745 RepID=UPI00156A4766|nr:hypothetical protein [Marinobacterium sp. xm-v-242]NRP53826.1 hypothetical protein [Marinobacterium sp. xm-v-242]
MCEPTTLALAALQGVSTVSQINDQNAAHSANRANSLQAQNDQFNDQGRQFVEQNRSLIQGGFDAILAGREAESMAYTSAIENGVQGASVRALMSNIGQKTSRSATRTQQERTSLSQQTGANFKHIRSSTQGRINSVASTRFGMGDVAKILTPIVRAEME